MAKSREANGYLVGVKRDAKIAKKPGRRSYGFSQEPMWKLANWLEYGTRRNGRQHMKPRPHWRPTETWVAKAFPEHMRKVLTRDVRGD